MPVAPIGAFACRASWCCLLLMCCLQAAHAAAQLLSALSALRDNAAPAAAGTCRMEPGAAHSYCGLPYELSNFQGHFKCDKDVIVGRPANIQELARLVQAYDHVKAVGVGHSWWREQFCAGNSSRAINIVTTELQERKSPITIDEVAMTATAPAGVTQRGLLQFLDAYRTTAAPDGYTLPAYSWFLDQTIGGAVATATHGSSLVFGSLSSQIKSLKLMVANGTTLHITPKSSPHLWRAAAVSIGRLGIVLEVTIAVVQNTPVRRDKADLQVPDFVADIKQLSGRYRAAAANSSAMGLQVWEAIKAWDETQWFWFIPSRMLWRASFKRQTPLSPADVERVLASDGPDSRHALLPGAFQQQSVQAAGSGQGIERNARFWSDSYRTFLAQNVAAGTLPARQAYLSVTEMESKLGASWNSYDQYEVAIPLSKAGQCVEALAAELYGPKALWTGFRTPALARLIRAESPYLSPAHGEPVLYINLEDHVSYATHSANRQFQVVMGLLRSPLCGHARLHWGKAGWTQEYGRCFDGAREYSRWCDFGCAVATLDSTGKFAGLAGGDVWRWRAIDKATQQQVTDFAGSCCGPDGFDYGRCSCASVNGAGCGGR